MNDIAEEYGMGRGRQKKRAANGPPPDRLPPNSPEAEQGVLGCILLAPNECMGVCVEKFRGKDVFYDVRYQTLYHVLGEMYEKQEAIDEILLHQKLKDKNIVEQVGGIAFLSALPDAVPSAANLSYYLDVVWEKYLLRKAVEAFAAGIETVYTFAGPAEDLLLKVEASVSELTETNAKASEEHIKESLRRIMNDLEENQYHRGSMQLRGLATGPPGNYLDKIIGGIRPTFGITMAGRPGSGKTALALNWTEFLACDYLWWDAQTKEQAEAAREAGTDVYENEQSKQWYVQRKGIPVGVFSIEMETDSLTERLLFGRAGVTTSEYRQGFKEKNADAKLLGAFTQLAKSNIYIDATPAQTIGQIAAKARRMVKQYGIKLFVLDYIQLVEMEGSDGFDRQKEITKISRKLMALKKQLKVPWLVLAQMNRNIETAERDRKPVLSDLKDCGALEQDADLVLFTYRTPRKELERVPEAGGPSQEEVIESVCKDWPWGKVPYRVDLVVPKNRFGPTGDAQMVFCKNLTRFEDWHLWKVKHGVESLKSGEGKALALPTNEEMNLPEK